MDFDLTKEHKDIQKAAREFALGEFRDVAREYDLNETFPAEIVKKAREIDLITVKGKNKPVRVYELLDEKGKLAKEKKDLLEEFDKGLQAYRKQDWDKAIKHFESALKIDKNDGPSKTYVERCKQLKTEKLPKDWDGVFVLTSK